MSTTEKITSFVCQASPLSGDIRSLTSHPSVLAAVLRQLKSKIASIDLYKRHGGLVFNEIKLSEHLSVKKKQVSLKDLLI